MWTWKASLKYSHQQHAHLNTGTGNAWASHNKLYMLPECTSNESDFADLGNVGDTLPTGSKEKYLKSVFLQINCIMEN